MRSNSWSRVTSKPMVLLPRYAWFGRAVFEEARPCCKLQVPVGHRRCRGDDEADHRDLLKHRHVKRGPKRNAEDPEGPCGNGNAHERRGEAGRRRDEEKFGLAHVAPRKLVGRVFRANRTTASGAMRAGRRLRTHDAAEGDGLLTCRRKVHAHGGRQQHAIVHGERRVVFALKDAHRAFGNRIRIAKDHGGLAFVVSPR